MEKEWEGRDVDNRDLHASYHVINARLSAWNASSGGIVGLILPQP